MSQSNLPITFEDVAAAAELLRGAGDKISMLGIRDKLGRGSFTTIRKHLDRFQSEVQPERPAVAPLPPQLETLWQAALSEAKDQLATDRAALEQLSEQLDQRLAQLETAVMEADRRRVETETRLIDKDFELQRLDVLIDDYRQQRDAADAARIEASTILERERTIWMQRFDGFEDKIAGLTQALTGLAQPVAGVRGDLKHLGGQIMAAGYEVRAELAEQKAHNQDAFMTLVQQPIARLVGATEELQRQAQLDRRLWLRTTPGPGGRKGSARIRY